MFPHIVPDEVPACLRFRCHKIPPGDQVKGWINGPIVMAVVHWADPHSKPCLDAMSGGKLLCKCKDEPIAKRKIGYVPLLSSSGERIVVIVSNLVAADMIKLSHGSPVVLTRSRVPCAPLKCSTWPNYECGEEKTKRVRTYTPVDIQGWLLHLWKAEALTRYYKSINSATATPADSAYPHSESDSVIGAVPSAREDVSTDKPSLINPRRKRPKAG